MADVGEVKYKVTADDSGLDQQIDKTESKMKSKFGQAAGVVGKAALGALAAGTAAVAKLATTVVDGAKETAALGDNIDKMSQKIGISAQAFQEWDYIFSQNGADISILETGMKTLSSAVADAGNGSKSAQEKFKQLGLSFDDLGKMSQEDMFGAVIEQLQTMPEGAERTALAADLLGKSAMELGPLLNQTAEDTAALKDQAHELGMVMTDEAVKASADFTDAQDNLRRAVTGAKGRLMGDFLPGLTAVTNGLADLAAGNDGAVEHIQSGFKDIAGAVTNSMPQIVGAISGMAVSIAEVAPDLVRALADGIIGSFPELIPAVTNLILELVSLLIKMAPELLKAGLELIISLAQGLVDALPELIPAVIDAIIAIVDALTDPNNLLMLVDAAIAIIIALAEGLIDALPRLIEKAPEIIMNLLKAIIQAAPKILQAGLELIITLARGIVQAFGKLIEVGAQIVQNVKNGFSQKVYEASNWGRDIIDNFINGIRQKWQDLVNTVKNVANTVKSYLGFSVPETGPLHDFASYAPDMMDLYAKGIDDNVDKVEDSVENVSRAIAGTFSADVGYNLPDISGYAADLSASLTAQATTNIEVPLYLDGREIARGTAWYMSEQLAWEAR